MKLFAVLAVVLFIGAAIADPVDLYAGEITGSQCVPSSGYLGGVWGNAGLNIDWDEEVAYIHLTHSIPPGETTLPQPTLRFAAAGTNAPADRLSWTFTTNADNGFGADSANTPCFGMFDFSGEDYTKEQLDQLQMWLSNGMGYISFGGPAPYEDCAARAQIASIPSLGATVKFEGTLNGENEVPPYNTTGNGEVNKAEYDSRTSFLDIEFSWDDLMGETTSRDYHIHFGAVGFTGPKIMYVPRDGEGDSAKTDVFINLYSASQMVAGASYINIHSDHDQTTTSAGEIRGNLFVSELNVSSASSMAIAFGAVVVALLAALL